MIRLIITDVKRIFTSWQFYFSILLLVISAFITIQRNLSISILGNLETIGTLNLFFYGCIHGNILMLVLAPFIPVFVYGTAVYDDIRSGNIKNTVILSSKKKYFTSKIISTAFGGSLAFLVAYIFLFILFFIIDPSPSVRTDFRFGLFLNIFDKSLLLYCFAFILHAMLFGLIYALFGLGLSLILKNKFVALGLPVVLYYTTSFIRSIFPQKIADILLYFVPFMTFETTVVSDIIKNISQLSFILLISIILITIGIKRWKKGVW